MRRSFTTFLILIAASSMARMIGPSQLPAERVIRNLEARLAKNPKDGEAEYLLGRTHYALYCAGDPRVIALYGTDAAPRFPSTHPSLWEFQEIKPQKDPKQISRAKSAIKHLQKAVHLGGGEPGLYELTLACAFEASSQDAPSVQMHATRKSFLTSARSWYIRSFQESRPKDVTRPYAQMPMTYENWISIEAAAGVLRIDPKSSLKKEIEAHRLAMSKLPSGPITPLIFSLTTKKSLNELLDSSRIVKFDLDGTGAPQQYAWVKPTTAFLVWQPYKGNAIRSGRQLFGSATWWLMPPNAYAAMSLLDDNTDGWLTGRELLSLAVWQDSNQNGVAEPREVNSVSSVGIAGLKTSYDARAGQSLVSLRGLRMSDGRIIPSYDWVTSAR